MDNRLIFLYSLIFDRARLERCNFRVFEASAEETRILRTESGASSGVTRLDNWSMLMNSCASCKLMLLQVNPLKFASNDAKYSAFGGTIPSISTV